MESENILIFVAHYGQFGISKVNLHIRKDRTISTYTMHVDIFSCLINEVSEL